MAPHLLLPSPTPDFNFNSTSTTPYATAPSTPKLLLPKENNIHDMDFAFDSSGHLNPPSVSDADDLFHGGIIKPSDPLTPPSSKLSPVRNNTKNLKSNFSEALRRTPNVQTQNPPPQTQIQTQNQSSVMGFTWYNKWNLKNLLLFRSTSEGSAAKITKEDLKASSFRSCDGSVSRRMKRKMSAHEMHYTANRAVAEERRRKTSLPYKSGLLGCLGFSHDLREVSRRR